MKRFPTFIFIAVWCLIVLVMPSVSFAQKGTRESGKITSPALEGNLIGDPATRTYFVYLPPSYKISETGEKHYPCIYVLHGFAGNEESLLVQVSDSMNIMIKSRRIEEMIAIFVDGGNKFGGSQYRSSVVIGDYEGYIARDLVNHIDVNYRTIADRKSRGITGFSMGGIGSMHLALKFPEVFSVVVAQAGVYDMGNDWWKKHAEATAFANPKDWAQLLSVGGSPQVVFSYSATASPNPNNPPFFLDKPFELVDGEAKVVPEIWKSHAETDILHGDVVHYLKQPTRLNGIKIVHGRSDNVVPVNQAQAFDKVITDLGINHEYKEHGGGHAFLPEESLQFLSDKLEGEIQ